MRKEDIINELSKHMLDKKTAKTAVDNIIKIIKSGLDKDGKVVISNFGVFTKVKTKTVTRHNPKTLEKVLVAPQTKIRFKAAPALTEK
ncbi:nucleoid DNA-binding protein [Elusimicrobium posterum]|uniref:HU family DNA-binding protein n=1 Tax=Elusimicrobium posterum TaxID=3116653 RepID=UPI003C732BA7